MTDDDPWRRIVADDNRRKKADDDDDLNMIICSNRTLSRMDILGGLFYDILLKKQRHRP
jgi:hypothetical protein